MLDHDVPLSSTEIQRAKEARKRHVSSGHPSDEVYKDGLANRLWAGVDLVPRDVDNSNRLFGKCTSCLESKAHAPSEPDAMNLKPERPGMRLYFDSLPLDGKSLGGYVHALVGSDGYSGFITVNGMRNKMVTTVKDTLQIVIAFYRSYGWTVDQLVFDRDPSFLPLEHAFPGISVTFYPAGMKNKVAERAIQDLLMKRRSILNSLPYHIPAEIELKSYEAAAKCMSLLPNSRTGPSQCPHFLVTKLRTVLPTIAFGKPVLAYARSSKDHDIRAEYGMYIDQAYHGDYLIYNPTFINVVSKRKIEEIVMYPAGWKLLKSQR